MADKINKIIFGSTVSFNKDLIDEDIIKSVKLYLAIKDETYRNFCPFVMKHVECKDICGRVFYYEIMKDNKKCPLTYLTKDMLYQIMTEIINISEKKLTDPIGEVFG